LTFIPCTESSDKFIILSKEYNFIATFRNEDNHKLSLVRKRLGMPKYEPLLMSKFI